MTQAARFAGLLIEAPAGALRWTILRTDGALEPGEWLKTGRRGAEALLLRLESGGEHLLGSNRLVEL